MTLTARGRSHPGAFGRFPQLDAVNVRPSQHSAHRAAGYRASRDQRHYRTIASLPLLIGPEVRELSDFLDSCRTRRHDLTYESLAAVSDDEAEELIQAVGELETRVRDWLRSGGLLPGASS